ncbi:hypothetical protein GCM10022402_05970 [Salinactinospora qingdaonensis]|uniref:Uncharacterized protein n=1 Tax=Salinactinospora qingdaonensis TaxID=702744 RepID=A0ABP7EZ15_9ACTN
MTVACLVFVCAGIGMVIEGTPSGIAFGVGTIVLFSIGGVLAATPALSSRPFLELDDHGVRVVQPWPVSRTEDRTLPWGQVAAITAYTEELPYRDGQVSHHFLSFVPNAEAEPTPREGAAGEEAATELLPAWERPYTLHISHNWDTPVADIVAYARRHRPDLPFYDQRIPLHGSGHTGR